MAKEPEKKEEQARKVETPVVDLDEIVAQRTEAAVAEAVAKATEEALANARKEWEAEAKAKADAKAAEKATATATKAANPKAKIDPMEERVTVHLFKGEGFEKPRFVAVNGETCRIPRGKPVQIKRKFALVLENSDRQDAYAMDLMTQMQSSERNLGVLTRK